MQPGFNFGVSEQSDETFLESTKAALDLSLGLRGGSDEMRHPQGFECPLKLASGIALIIGGAGAEKAQCVGINGLRYAPCLEGGSKVTKVVPSGVSFHETTSDIQAGMIVQSEL